MTHSPTLRGSLGRLTVAKGVSNTALRWVPPFLPTLERAFGASTAQMTTLLGVGEMAGLSTLVTGRHLRVGRERLVLAAGLVAVTVASLVTLVGSLPAFAVGTILVVLGVTHVTVAGHTFIGNRVDYDRRARAIGLFETSWALSLLIGAPLIAGLIALTGWRGPYVALAIGSALVALLVVDAARRAHEIRPTPRDPVADVAVAGGDTANTVGTTDGEDGSARLGTRARLVVAGAAFIPMAGLSVFAISGSWLDDAFGVPTGGLGAVAMGFGAVELVSSLTSAAFADRWGKRRSTIVGCATVVVGTGVIAVADDTLWIGVVGLLVFLLGFEYAIVTSFSLVTEAAPGARGRTIGLSNAVGTVARAIGVIVGGLLYEAHGVEGTLVLSAVAAVLAAGCFAAARPVSRP